MRTETQMRKRLAKLKNVAQWARKHQLCERTVWRVRCGGEARAGTLALLNAALDREKT